MQESEEGKTEKVEAEDESFDVGKIIHEIDHESFMNLDRMLLRSEDKIVDVLTDIRMARRWICKIITKATVESAKHTLETTGRIREDMARIKRNLETIAGESDAAASSMDESGDSDDDDSAEGNQAHSSPE